MIGDAEVPADHLGDACRRPQLVGEAVRLGSLIEEVFQLPQLRLGQAAFGAGYRFGRQAWSLACHPPPAVQGGGCDAQDAGDHTRGFALLDQRDGTPPSSF